MRSSHTPHTARAAARLLTLAAVLGLLSGCMLFRRAPEDLDYSRTRTSEGGIYRGTIHPPGDSIPRGRTDGGAHGSAPVRVAAATAAR